MAKKWIGRLLMIASAALLLSAAIFICLCLLAGERSNMYLGIALGDLILSSLCSIVRRQTAK